MANPKELARLRAIEAAANGVVQAAWTDRFSRLHGHPSVVALDAALRQPPVEVLLGNAWLTDRAERDMPTGEVIAKRGSSSLVRLRRDDAAEMLTDLEYYAKDVDACSPGLVRSARANLPKLRAALAST